MLLADALGLTVDFQAVTSMMLLLCLTLILPLTIFIGRSNIKTVRQKIIADLEGVFRIGSDNSDSLIPSFEFAAYKYRALPHFGEPSDRWEWRSYLLPVLVFIMVTYAGFLTSLGLMLETSELGGFDPFFVGMRVPDSADSDKWPFVQYQMQTIAVLCFTFAAAYIWSIDYLVRRISNYDLSPISFLRVTGHIMLACVTSVTLHHGYVDIVATAPLSIEADGVPELIVAFLIGFFPKLGLHTLVSRVPQLQIRRVDERAQSAAREYPIDMVTGISGAIKFRLAEFEIEDVQNLATANPILLFVETPYGIYETMDWVAQAQLMVSVDYDQLQALRLINVRTVFDLERFLEPLEARRLLVRALNTAKTDAKGNVLIADRGIDERSVVALVNAILKDLHVQRLRQVWRNVELKLNFDLPHVRTGWATLGGPPGGHGPVEFDPPPLDEDAAGEKEDGAPPEKDRDGAGTKSEVDALV